MIAPPSHAAQPPLRLHLRRTFPARRERVFRAWTDPAWLRQWWGPRGYTTPLAEIDLRVGGRFRLGMQPPEGEVNYLTGTYREVLPPERLVYTWRWEGVAEAEETLVTVEFLDRGEATEVVLTHERFTTKEAVQIHEEGWAGCLDRLDELLESPASPSP